MFIGEAETTWPEFLEDFARGRPTRKRYQQSKPTDMAEAPRPRYDLLKADRYASGALQYSRGCPFECEFCDIIVIYGRKPRTKPPEQFLAELDDMRRAGFHSAFIVDDNFIGNRKKAKALLEEIIPWMERHGYPLRLTTEASIDLADQPEIMELMYRANFRSVFIGIGRRVWNRSRKPRSFRTRAATRWMPSWREIQNAGLDVNAGFIVGFDSDDREIFEDQFRFIQENGITGDGRHAPGNSQDAALRTAQAGGPAGRGRSQLQLRSQTDEPRGASRRLLESRQAALRSGRHFWSGISRFSSFRSSSSGAPKSAARREKARACRPWPTGWRPCSGRSSGPSARRLADLGGENLPEILLGAAWGAAVGSSASPSS